MKQKTWVRIMWASVAVMTCIAQLGCAAADRFEAPVKPAMGSLFTDVKMPLTINFNGNPNGPGVMKFSQSNTAFFRDFFLTGSSFGWDDVDIAKIAREGGIDEVSYADYEIFSILGIYGKFTVNVYGRESQK